MSQQQTDLVQMERYAEPRLICRRCGENKPLSDMKHDKRNVTWFSSFCKACHQSASVAWQKANPEKLNATR